MTMHESPMSDDLTSRRTVCCVYIHSECTFTHTVLIQRNDMWSNTLRLGKTYFHCGTSLYIAKMYILAGG